jgi:acyl-phosphate glycerol-3-phosphate acyltransferase
MLPALIICAYLIGSISAAIIVCKILKLPDPRTQGSNNPGATNVLRIGGKKAAAVVLIGDGLKRCNSSINGSISGHWFV